MTFSQARRALAAYVVKKGSSQARVAAVIGCGKGHLCAVLAGKKSFGLKYAPKIESEFGIPASAWDRRVA